jgi:hypothetical protein
MEFLPFSHIDWPGGFEHPDRKDAVEAVAVMA